MDIVDILRLLRLLRRKSAPILTDERTNIIIIGSKGELEGVKE